ncbi:MAG: hypothetical protein ACK4FK_14695 [Ferrovibrio sp.]|uniref:hypothetical protein n=1 Tax=Ferrovibrio sp. TaxID=1917215 RepID=UPI00391D6B00
MAFAIKAGIGDPGAETFRFVAQKTMYGGKRIAAGDAVFVFASDHEGGRGLIARGMVVSAKPVAKKPGLARQTPRVSLTVRIVARAKRPLGRNQLKGYADWDDGRPETELNFKFYRQATNKIIGLSDDAARFLDRFF